MAKYPQHALAKKRGLHRPLTKNPRYEIVFEERSWEGGAVANVLAELKSLGERGGSAIGYAYVLVARAVLNGIERLEDLNAERRFRQRGSGSPLPSAPASALAARPKKSLPPK